MTSFMGPMAPPPAAPPQPQAMDFQTDPNNRQRFRQFLNNRMQPPMMQQPSMMQAPMMQPPAHMPPILPEIDIFAPQGFEDGGSVPPRRTDIRGQDHMLSYITPDEADILKALGGSGEAGPMGIPAYFDVGEGDFGYDSGGNSADTAGGRGDPDGNDYGGGSDADEVGDASQVGDMFDSYDDSGSDADEQGDAIAEQAVIDQIVSDNEERQRQVDQLVRDDTRQDLINRRSLPSPQVQTEIDQLKSNPANIGPAGQLLAEIRGAPATDTGIASVNTGASKGTSPTSSLLGGNNLLGDTDTYRDALDRRAAERSMNPADFEAQYGFAPLGVTAPKTPSIGVMTPSDDLNTDNMNFVNTPPNNLVDIGAAGLGVNPNPNIISDMAMGTPNPNVDMTDDLDGPPTATTQNTLDMEDEYLDEDIAAGFGQYVGGPGGGPGSSGLDTFASRQQRAADYAKEMGYDLTDRSVNKQGAERGFGGITKEQEADLQRRAESGIIMGLNARNINNILENNRATGIYTNPDGTVRGVTGLPDPDGFLQKGVDFVSGFMPNFIGETYTGVGADPFDRGEDPGGPGGDGPVDKKSVLDPCPPGFSLVNGVCTPVSDAGSSGPVADPAADPAAPIAPLPVIVPSSRQVMPFAGTMPSGYGTAVTGGVNPLVMSEMQKYAKLLSRPQPQYPVGLANGGPVSSNLDMAADNFLKALMPAA